MAFSPEVQRLVFYIFQVYCVLVNLFFRFYNQLFVKREKIAPPKDEILLSSATKLAEKIRKKELTSSQVLEAFIGRVEEVNPVLNAVVVKLYDDARATAKKVDERLAKLSEADRQKLAETEPLLGVPISIKDNFDVAGKVCTAGSPLRKDNVAKKDAVVVANLRAAGAIPFVMTNVPECVIWLECSNVVYGKTGNAHDPRRNPGGSSGGEGSLVGSAGSVFGIGNDLGGSVRCPSFLNGIFGLKPSPNKNSKVGVFPFVRPELYISDMFVNGPLCRYAEDLELLFKVEREIVMNSVQAMGGQVAKDLWKKEPLPAKKQRFFFLEGFHCTFIEELNEDQRGALYRVVNHIRSEWDLPVTQVEFEELASAPEIYTASFYDAPADEPTCWDIITQGQYKHNKWLDFPKAILGQSKHSPQPYYITLQLDLIQWWSNIPERRQEFIALREQLKKRLFTLLGDDGVLIFPTQNCVADFYNGMGFKQNGWYYTAFWNSMLVPSVTCPIGKNADGMPLGVQVIGPPDSDARILEVAKEFEKAFGGWSLAE